ncbi:MAG: hypothetical protein Q7V57_09415 [Actinomycetota bacterium]|nr:hypothetical protein [Actinomycetota bacterium]
MSRRGARALILLLPGLLLAGCFTGKRPHFEDDPYTAGSLTGDANIDAVLTKLDAVTDGPVSAGYSILTKYGNVTRSAVVVLDAGQRSINIGNVHYIDTQARQSTCTVDLSAPCINGLDPARISDTLATIDFYAAEPATRLRRDNAAKIGPSEAHTEIFAGQSATCVNVPLAGGTAVYCALDSGVLAKMDDGDLLITLALYADTADASQFVPPAG